MEWDDLCDRLKARVMLSCEDFPRLLVMAGGGAYLPDVWFPARWLWLFLNPPPSSDGLAGNERSHVPASGQNHRSPWRGSLSNHRDCVAKLTQKRDITSMSNLC